MKQIYLLLLSILFCAILQAETIPATGYAGGSGTSSDPYQIATLAQLRLLSETSGDWASYFILTADIDATDTKTWNGTKGFSCIGNSVGFTGCFDGNGYVIDNLYIKTTITNFGMFGYIKNATIKNLGLTNCYVGSAGDRGGALIGRADSSIIEKCYATGAVFGIQDAYGSGINTLGSLIGLVTASSTVTSCYSTCNVTAWNGGNVGGLVGIVAGSSTIEDCFVGGEIGNYNTTNLGGIAGQVQPTAVMKNCYFFGSTYYYAITGKNSGTISNCYYDKTIFSKYTDKNGTGISTEDFADMSNFADWNFENVWAIGKYSTANTVMRPYLQWMFDHVVTFKADKNRGFISGNSVQGVNDGDDAEEVTAKASYSKLIEWQDADGNQYSTANPLTVSNVTGDITLTAVFEIYTHSVKFYSSSNGTINENAEQTVEHGLDATAVTATATTGGYVFTEWQDMVGNKVSTDNPLTIINVTQDSALIAVFEIDSHSVNFSTDGNGTISGESVQEVEYGSNATAVSAIPNGGYDFVKWQSTDGTLISTNNPLIIYNVQCDTSLQAVFEVGNNDKIITYSPSKDAYIYYNKNHSERANSNFGDSNGLLLFCEAQFDNYCQTLISFSELEVPIAAIKDVNLKLYNNGTKHVGNNPFNVYWFTEEWEETEITWNNAPLLNADAPYVTMPTNVVNTQDFSIDVTDLFISNYQESDGEAGFRLKHIDYNGDKKLYLASRENTEYNTPSLNLYIKEGYYSVQFATDNSGSISGKTTQVVEQGANTSEVKAEPNAGYNFKEWQDKNGDVVSSDNPLTINNVTSDITIHAVFDISTGILDNSMPEIAVDPNPTTGVVYINGVDKATISVYSITGKLVYSNQLYCGSPIDLSGLPQGIYLLKVTSKGKSSVIKIIKE